MSNILVIEIDKQEQHLLPKQMQKLSAKVLIFFFFIISNQK